VQGRSAAPPPHTGTANPRTLAAGTPAAKPAPPVARQAEPALPQGILIFLDGDQSGERLPLGTAQARIAEVVRDSGRPVVSSGAVAANVRAALDRRDLAEVRQNGVGYVIMGTAHGSLEQQNAYGSTYNVARASVSLELVRMSDGAVASTGTGDARSRGSANAAAALQEALTTATSDAARALMRDFKP
jgi:hypothetical protein